ncbi:hypothetical protein JCM6294_2263 [Bacteroides pyogenes DSM 20611 = JCM 6294]|uniref:Uncharacterized protein n=1 Tax=Bacteroides pyogenes DSM 20611 = JCM 6294 TaxID=1121100 RepID=W4PHE0_9BACE|nr:hypothetical protein JCM6294_2263 [Bacteroides pyogenes DSM 20611 = JCM 6294]
MGNFCFIGGKLFVSSKESLCFIKREPLFHQKRASVLSKESLCFIEREALFHRSRASVSSKQSLCFTQKKFPFHRINAFEFLLSGLLCKQG